MSVIGSVAIDYTAQCLYDAGDVAAVRQDWHQRDFYHVNSRRGFTQLQQGQRVNPLTTTLTIWVQLLNFKGSQLWNRLPKYLINIKSHQLFKKNYGIT